MRVADYITSFLKSQGVDTVFILNGGMMMHMVDSLGERSGVDFVCNHHEQASAIAADAYARRRQGLGACYATSGPGATNLLTGLVGAWQDSTPVIFITGQSRTNQTIEGSGIEGLRQFGTFEVDIVPIVKSVTKYAVQVRDPSTVRYHLEKAAHLALSGRPGPVLLDLPLDIQGSRIEVDSLKRYAPEIENFEPGVDDLGFILDEMGKAKRPLILAGYGIRCANAVKEFRALVEELGIPVATSQLGKDVLYYDHPLFVGHPGPKGDRAGNFAVQTADFILSLGCSLHAQTTGWESDLFAPTAMKIQVDLDDAVLARENVNVTRKVRAGSAEVIAAIAASAQKKRNDLGGWRERCASWKLKYSVRNEPHKRSSDGINYYHFAEALSVALPAEACVVADAGSSFYVMGQAFRVKNGQRFISSGSMGAMGFGLPAANGAAAAGYDGPAVCVTGDGSLMSNLHELATAREFALNTKVFVINNDGYVSMRNTQNSFFPDHRLAADSESGVYIPPMDQLASTFGIKYQRCDSENELPDVIAEVLRTEGPVLCEIVAQRNQDIIPTVTSIKLEDGSMKSAEIQNMSPYLPQDQLADELRVDNLETA